MSTPYTYFTHQLFLPLQQSTRYLGFEYLTGASFEQWALNINFKRKLLNGRPNLTGDYETKLFPDIKTRNLRLE